MLVGNALKQFLAKQYLIGSTELTYRLLKGRAGPRDFSRVVIVAAVGRNNGIASGARLQYSALRQLGVDVEIIDATPALRSPTIRIPHRPGSAYVFHSGGPQTACLIRSMLPHAAAAYRIAYWAWELPDPPDSWNKCDRNVAEIWTPSAFARSSLIKMVSRPVDVVPHHVPAVTARQRRHNAPFTVLAMADSRSSFARKNPSGALAAFRMAFGTSKSARLLLKLNGNANELCALEASFGDLSDVNVEIIKDPLSPSELTALYRKTDVLLSLHRAEGFGLPMAEAMAHGVPVVATGWSGNLEFMSPFDSRLVPYQLIPVDDASTIYARSVWADPDLPSAAQALRDLADQPTEYARLAAAAHRRISDRPPQFPFNLPSDAASNRMEALA